MGEPQTKQGMCQTCGLFRTLTLSPVEKLWMCEECMVHFAVKEEEYTDGTKQRPDAAGTNGSNAD